MKRITYKIMTVLLAMAMLVSALPLTTIAAELGAQEAKEVTASGSDAESSNISSRNTPEYLEISDGYITVRVSVKNGGFYVGTAEGDVIVKSDNDKNLTYNDDEFDTSFTSFRVTRGEKVTDLIFGRNYAYLGIETSAVNVYMSADNAIVADWQADGIIFKQTIALMGADTYQHGMAYVAYSATNTTDVPVDSISARVLVDTALGDLDYGYYMLGQNDGSYVNVDVEKSFSGEDYSNYFFAYDNKTDPSVTAYMLNGTVGGESIVPEKVTFAHWMDLAGTVYDYTPSTANPVRFTEVYGSTDKLTADSAFALYYDLGKADAKASSDTVSFYYGVYSNYKAGSSDVAVNFTASGTMFFNDDETAYKDINGDNPGNFSSTIKLTNIADKTFGTVSVAVYPEEAISLHSGTSFVTSSQDDPFFKTVTELKPGETRDVRIDLQLDPTLVTSYRRVRLVLFSADSKEGFTDENRIVEKELYVLCPGAQSAEVGFTGMTPESVFMKGKRFAYITGTNFSMIRDTTQYRMILEPRDGGESIVLDMDKVVVNPELNTATLVLDMELRPTTYDIVIDWNDTTVEDMRSEALQLVVTDVPSPGDPGYVSSGVYGIITIERNGTKYDIVNYATEEEYENTATAQKDIMLVLRGDFNVLSSEGQPNFKAEAVTLMAGEVITINDCLEVKEGRVTVTKIYNDKGEQTSIDVDIDGKLYTAVENTKVWDGILAISSFEQGKLYTLPVYDEQGIVSYREGEEDGEIIKLIWPGAASVSQTIAGLILNFRYGEFAVMEQGDSIERVVAFGAALDPSILVPPGMVGTQAHYSNLEKAQLEMGISSYTASQLRANDTKYAKDQAAWRNQQQGTLNLYMDDILFGAGGFIGFNTQIEVGIPAYTEPLPYIRGSLALKIINEYWEVGVEGEADMMVFEMEASLKFKRYEGIPFPDEIYFFIGGTNPGIPVDPFGVFWVRGAGAGISDIYDTFFGGNTVPPLTLMISGEFALFSQLSARADLAISARGFEGYMSNVSVAGVTIIDRVGGHVYWYPDLSISFAIRVDILDCIIGEGGIVLNETDDGLYFCGYASATVKIPDSIWFIGGTEIGSASIGIDTEKVWGSVKVIGVGVGIKYYWGGDVDVAVGKTYDVPSPLMAMQAIPVYSGAEGTLYMTVENDITLLSDESAGLEYTEITTSTDGTAHSFTLNASSNEDALIVLSFNADSLFRAQDLANSVKVKVYSDEENYELYALERFVNELAADHEQNVNANSMFRYDAENGTATLSISITDNKYYGKPITVSADGISDIQLFGIGRLTSLDGVELDEALMEATIVGSGLHKLSKVSLYAEDKDGALYPLGELGDTEFGEGEIKVPVTVPMNLPTGEYVLRAVGVVLDSDGKETESPMTEGSFEYVNSAQPKAPTSAVAALSGDYTVTATVTVDGTDRDGYLTTVYEVTENGYIATVFSEIATALSGDELTALTKDVRLGGRYTTTDDNGVQTQRGLEAGKKYVVSVQSYKDMEDGSRLLSEPVVTNEVMMTMPILVDPEFSIDGSVPAELGKTGMTVDTVNKQSFTLNITATGFGSGTYKINDGETKAWDGKSIVFDSLDDGFYTLTVSGYSTNGDAFSDRYQFSVDSLAPSILMSSHQGGGFFEGNTVVMEGSTEAYSVITVYVEGELSVKAEADGEGRFSVSVPLDESLAYQDVKLFATDRAGNVSMPFGCELTNSILGEEKLRAVILLDGREVTEIVSGTEATQLSFALKSGTRYVTMNKGSTADSRIKWSTDIIEKSATVTQNGLLASDSGARGIVTASLEGKTAMVELVNIDLSVADLALDIPEGGLEFNFEAQAPKVVTDADITEGVDYTVSYVNNTNAGTASAIINATDDGKCVGTRIINFTINKRNVNDAELTVADDGSEAPEVSIKLGAHTLTRDVDYTLSYTLSEDGKEVIVTVEGMGNFEGLVTGVYKVKTFDHLTWIIPTVTVTVLAAAFLTLYIIKKRRAGAKRKTSSEDAPDSDE